MPRPKKIKSPEDLGKEFEKLKKTSKVGTFHGEPISEELFDKIYNEESKELTPLEELQELEKKLRACTNETPRDIRYEFTPSATHLRIDYNNINVSASIYDESNPIMTIDGVRRYETAAKRYETTAKKPYLETAKKMLEVLNEWSRK